MMYLVGREGMKKKKRKKKEEEKKTPQSIRSYKYL